MSARLAMAITGMVVCTIACPMRADVESIDASSDTTLYSKDDNLSNGAGDFFFAGRTDGGDLLRGVIAFDVAAVVPAGATITDVSLELYMSRTRGGTEAVALHRVTSDWGEGISDADGEEGGGANAENGDATWRYRFYDVDTPESSPAWTTLGGDFNAAASASINVGNNGFYTWGSTAATVADVQAWLDDPSNNFGWILVGNESANQTAKRFNTRQNNDTNRRPLLTVTFTPASGACCFDDGSCSVLDTSACASQGGVYSGDGTTCSPNNCPQPGACCLNDGTCSDVLESACTTSGGTFQGAGTNCATTDCDGACCFTNGSCLETTLTDCGSQGGTYQSFGSVCTPNPCSQPDGACCFGDGSCQVLTQSGCTGQGGSYSGDGTGCTPNSCPQPGACCQNDGTCSVIFESACTTSGGSYEGDGTTCTPNPCPQPGACCFDDGSCTDEFQADCDTALGQFQGGGTTCTPNGCPQPGACCFDDGTCQELLEANCTGLSGSYQGAGTTCTPRLCPILLTPFVDPLPLPAVAQPVSGSPGGVATYDIAMRQIQQQLHRDLPPTTVWGYGDGPTGATYPGPTIEAWRNETVTVNWINDLRDAQGALRTNHFLAVDLCPHGAIDAAKTVVHLHGGHVPPEFDGYPEDTYLPGILDTYEYANNQLPATLWFHDHALGITRLNVYMGLAGFYLLRDQAEADLNLPSGEFEIPLVIQDRAFNPDGSLYYPDAWEESFFGDKILVNGKVWPYLEVKQGKYRFRIVNGSNSRTYTLALSNGASFQQIGTDGGLLPQPITLSEITLSGAERADVIVDFSSYPAGTGIILTNSAPAPYPGTAGEGVIPDVMEFRVVGQTGHTGSIPATLTSLETLLEQDAVEFRDFELRRSSDPCAGTEWLINGLHWDDITERPILGTTEVWNFINRSGMVHPMHMHLVMFQILDRQEFDVVNDEIVPIGSPVPPADNEAGWKDTVRVDPNSIVRVIARFEDYTGLFSYHCHILEHEDHEMMRQFEVLLPPGDIPAVSTWGACVLLLVLLSAGTIIVRPRDRVTSA